MKEKAQQLKEVKFNKHWGSLAKGYLKLAGLGFLSLSKQKDIGRKTLFKGSKAIYSLQDGCMIIASIWNIKHGLELTIKGLGVNLNKKYWKKHDLDYLFNDLENKLKDYCVKKHIDILKSITQKYYTCNFSSKALYEDTKNDYFKYPESDGASLDYSFVHDLKRKDINLFLKDIHNLKLIYSSLEGQPQLFKQAKEWGLSKKHIEKRILTILATKKNKFKK